MLLLGVEIQPMNDVPPIKLPLASIVGTPPDHTPAGLKAWISLTSRFLGVTPTEWAKEADLAASTVNRFLRENDDGGNLSASTIEALISAARRIESDPKAWRG